jgi:hypothetical protein
VAGEKCHVRGAVSGLEFVQSRWSDYPESVQRLVLSAAVIAFPLWFTVSSVDVANYVLGAEQLLSLDSVYAPKIESPTADRLVPHYPYLPSFAMAIAVLSLPIEILGRLGILPEQLAHYAKFPIANLSAYASLVLLPLILTELAGFENEADLEAISKESRYFWGALAILLVPPLWFQTIESGSDILVATLAITGALFAYRRRWMLAGVFVGLSTFKFTGVPFTAIITGYGLFVSGRHGFYRIAAGGLLSQIPNAVYFLLFPNDLLYVIRRRGSLSYYSGETSGLMTSPIRSLGLEAWYIDGGFVYILVALTLLGLGVSIWRRDLLTGFAVGYIATSYLAPVRESNPSTFVVLVAAALCVRFHRRLPRFLYVALLTLSLYNFLGPQRSLRYITDGLPVPLWDPVSKVVFALGPIVILAVLILFDSEPADGQSEFQLEESEPGESGQQ